MRLWFGRQGVGVSGARNSPIYREHRPNLLRIVATYFFTFHNAETKANIKNMKGSSIGMKLIHIYFVVILVKSVYLGFVTTWCYPGIKWNQV